MLLSRQTLRKTLVFVVTILFLLTNINISVFAEYLPGMPAAIDPGTPVYTGSEAPVPAEPVPYDPTESMLKEIYNADLANGGTSYWMDRILGRSGSSGGADLFTRGRALYMYTHTTGTLGFAGNVAYREGLGSNMYTVALTGVTLTEDTSKRVQYPSYWQSEHNSAAAGLNVVQKKFITFNNVAVTELTIKNTGASSTNVTLTAGSPLATVPSQDNTELTGTKSIKYDLTLIYPRLSGDGMTVSGTNLTRTISLDAGQSVTTKVQFGAIAKEIPESRTDYERFRGYDPDTAFATQIKEYNEWWADNVPYIDIPDQNVKKMSYYRTFLNRFNYLDANIPGNDYQFPVSIEGVLGYNNAIQLTQPMHIQDLKYFRNPMFAYGDWLSSGESSKYGAFTDNPGNIANWNNTYEQYISEQAWQSYKVFGGQPAIVNKLARYAEGDAKGQLAKYDKNNNYLVQYDWGSLTGNDADAVAFAYYNRDQERTDESAFVYSGAKAASEMYELLGNNDKAEELSTLADNVRNAILTLLWDDSEGPNGKVFKQKDVQTGAFIPWKDQQNLSPFTEGVVPNTDNYKQALRFYADKAQFPIMPFFTANQYDKALAVAAGKGGSNNFSNINSTIQARLFAKAIREYPSDYITPDMYRKLIEWLTWTQYIGGDNRYPDNNEFWNSFDDSTKTLNYRSWIHHNILGSYNFSIIEDIAGFRPSLENVVELWPIDMGYDHFTINNLRYHNTDLTIVWDKPGDGKTYYGSTPEGYSVYIDGNRAFTVDDLARLRYDAETGTVAILDGSNANVLYSASASQLKEAKDVDLSGNARIVDMFQKAGADLTAGTGSAVNLAQGKAVSASFTATETATANAVDGYTVSGLTVKSGAYQAFNPIWGTKGSTNVQEWYEVDFGASTQFDSVKLYFYNDKSYGNTYREPEYYTVQYFNGTDWVNVPQQRKSVLQANYNSDRFEPVTAEKMRVLMTSTPGFGIALKEIQVFDTGIALPPLVNQAPVVEARQDAAVKVPLKASLVGIVTDDGLQVDLPEVTWSKKNGPGSVSFANSHALKTTANFTTAGTYTLTFTANDGEFSSSADVTVIVDPLPENINLAASATPSTSFVSSWETLSGINDGYDPTSSTDKHGAAYGNWNASSPTQWVQYTWPSEVVVDKMDVYWWTDNGGILMPTASKLQYLDADGSTWKDVQNPNGYGVLPNKYNTTTFNPVKTRAVRLTITRGTQWTGILEWKVYQAAIKSISPGEIHLPVNIGERPGLPATVQKVYAYNVRQEAGITWDEITDEQLQNGGTVININGYVDLSPISVPASIHVRLTPEVDITSFADAAVSTKTGVAPIMPSVVDTTYNDGSRDNMNVAVTWDTIDPSKYAQPGTFDVYGTVDGTSLQPKAVVTVADPYVVGVNPVNVQTYPGVAPILPGTVTAVYDEGATQTVNVTWDAVDPSKYASAGTFTVEGTIAGSSEVKAVATIKVNALTITSIVQPITVYTIKGVPPVMPTTVKANYNDGQVRDTAVTWGTVGAGLYGTVTQTMPVTSGSSNPRVRATAITGWTGTMPYIYINVYGVTAINDSYAVTPAGTAPALPATVPVALSDGSGGTTSSGTINVTWDTIDPAQYTSSGSFTVQGTVVATSTKANANVFVTAVDATAQSVNDSNVTTQELAAPVMPKTVTVLYSDGSNVTLPVTWAAIDPASYAAPGLFTVQGTVAGIALPAQANVTVINTTISSYKPVTPITTPRTMPILPATVTAVYGNGTTQPKNVEWDTIDSTKYAQPGTFTVDGTVDGSALPVTATVTVWDPNVSARIGNPLFTNIFTADPGALTYRNTFYIYAGHDEATRTSTDFVMNDWHVLTSTDMQHWNDNGPVMRYDVFKWANGRAYAGQTIEKNGKWYWYAPVGTASNGFSIGVAVSDSPLGPWKDAKGSALINNSTPNGSSLNIDPTIFMDTDGQAYLYWGSYNVVRMVKLNDDMISFTGTPVAPEGLPASGSGRYWEAPYLNKIGDKYYFSYAANQNPATIDYATADSPMGPWTYMGTINDKTSSPTNHDAIQEFRGIYYFVYHTSDVSGGFDYQRNVAVDIITVNPDGTLNKVVQTTTGPEAAPVDSNIAYFASTQTSYVTPASTILALNDGYQPYNSNDRSKDIYVTETGDQWVEYDFASPRTANSMDVYWYDNGNNVKAPSSYILKYWDGSSFVEVPNASGYGTELNKYNTTSFDMITTTKLRLEFTSNGAVSTGIEEWKVNDPKTVTSINGPVEVSTSAGTPAELPETLTANTVDGSTKEVAVTWASIPPTNYASPRTFTVEGTIADSDARVIANITVEAVPGEEYISELLSTKAVTVAGTAPVLPATVKAIYTDNSVKDESVTWDAVDPASYKLPRQFTVQGTVAGTDSKASVTVIVIMDPTKANVATQAVATASYAQPTGPVRNVNDGIEPTSSNSTPNYNNWNRFGTEYVTLTWAAPVTVNKIDVYWFADGNTGGVKAPVSNKLQYWDGTGYVDVSNASGYGLALNRYNTTTFDPVTTTALRLTFTGTGTEATGIMEWKVYDAKPVKTIEIINQSIKTGDPLNLPETVTVTYLDDSTQELAVTWDETNGLLLDQEGTFRVFGTVEGTNVPAIADITVSDIVAPTITGINAVNVTTEAGTAPELPAKVTAVYSDDSTGLVDVTWDEVAPEQYATAGEEFTVEGTVEGTEIKAEANVTVKEATPATIVSINEVNVTTEVGTAPKLPDQVTAVYDDESTDRVDVIWEEIDPELYAIADTEFTVTGAVYGTDIEAAANVTVIDVEQVTHTITANAGSHGSIDPDGDVTVKDGEDQTFTFDANSGYKVSSVEVDGEDVNAGSSYTFRNVKEDHTISITFTKKPSPNPGSTTTPPAKEPKVEDGVVKVTAPVLKNGTAEATITQNTITKALATAPVDADGTKTVTLDVPKVAGANEYKQTLPAAALTTGSANTSLEIVTDIAKLEVGDNMFSNSSIQASTVSLSIAKVDKAALSADIAQQIGDRPVIELNAFAGSSKISWSNNEAPVTVSLKYIPKNAEELANGEFITVWYIDGQGKAVPVTNARYNAATGEVTFSTTHFSKYALVYAPKTFSDLKDFDWAKHSIDVMATKGAVFGTTENVFSPSANITRADFLKFIITTLDMKADFTENFTDVNRDAYYYDAVGIAKKLGIVNGVGDGRFDPSLQITRQDMMVMTARALKLAKGLDEGSMSDLAGYEDAGKVSAYAQTSVAALVKAGIIKGSNGNINPLGNTTRAEAAVIMYRLYNLK